MTQRYSDANTSDDKFIQTEVKNSRQQILQQMSKKKKLIHYILKTFFQTLNSAKKPRVFSSSESVNAKVLDVLLIQIYKTE